MSWLRRKNPRDLLGGALMVLIGCLTMLEGNQYFIGSMARMGPGFFPIALGAVLVLLGILIAATADDAGVVDPDEQEQDSTPQWRGWGCIVGGMVAFIGVGQWVGLMPATFALVFISAMGDSEQTVGKALLLALGVMLGGAFIFTYLLQLQFPLIRWG